MHKKRVTLHACCAVCLGYPHKILTELGYSVEVVFYNPNIFPQEEYSRRKAEVERFCALTKTPLKIFEDEAEVYYKYVEGLEGEAERGLRCERCFQLRLDKTAEYAKETGADFFSTTLSVSPHKSFAQIKLAAETAARKFDVEYLAMDFKKQNGFKQTSEIANSYGFYRQNYCGCEFSVRKPESSLQKA